MTISHPSLLPSTHVKAGHLAGVPVLPPHRGRRLFSASTGAGRCGNRILFSWTGLGSRTVAHTSTLAGGFGRRPFFPREQRSHPPTGNPMRTVSFASPEQEAEVSRIIGEYISYDPETGLLTFKKTWVCSGHTFHVGEIATRPTKKDGYLVLRVQPCGRAILAHRAAWFLHHGEWPIVLIDHDDHDKVNNRKANLRLATQSQNMCNRSAKFPSNTSGFHGVYWHRPTEKWRATIRVNQKRIEAGAFRDKVAAAHAYDAAARRYHGQFAFLNFPDQEAHHTA